MDKNYWNYVQSKRAAFTNVKVRDRVDGSIGHALQEAEVVITNLTQIVFAEIMLPARTAHRRLHSVSFQWAKWKIFLLYWSPASCPRLRAAAAACEPSICQNGRSAKYLNPGLVLIRPLKHFGMFEHWSLPVPPLLLPPPSLPRTESRNKVENLKWMKAEDWSCLLLHAQFLILALLHHLTILPLTCNAEITRKSHTSDTNILHTQKICSR